MLTLLSDPTAEDVAAWADEAEAHHPKRNGGCRECGTSSGHCFWRALAVGQQRIAEALASANS